jgi:cyclohexanone monooxygenase
MPEIQGSEAAYDADALRRKYNEERDKRMRADGEAQYIDAVGDFKEFDEDPYIKESIVRDPVSEDVEVAIIGGGLGGQLTAVELRKRGIDSFRILEQAGDFGGTWYWNRYPGIRCDIEAYVYMPLLEEVGTVPSERYASGGEIFKHCQAIGRHFNLYDRALFQTKVESVKWDDDAARWIIRTNKGDEIRAHHVTVSQGPLAKVKLPGIPGIKSFKGKMFHSARWDYDYTGGTMQGGMTGLSGKRVAVIGTGATAVQIIPKLAETAKEVLVFQRTPSALAARNNSKTDVQWFKNQPKGWQKERVTNFETNITPGTHPDADIVGDGWTDFFHRVRAGMGAAVKSGEPFNPMDVIQKADFEKMEDLRTRIAEIVEDPALAARMTPWYNYLCKRPLFSDDFLESLNKPNVTVVDTDGKGVTEIDETAVHANGTAYEVDCIIFATGFDVAAAAHKVGGYELVGRDGLTVDEKWKNGMRTVHGTQMHGFPNFHVVGAISQGTTSFNYTIALQIQADHAVDIIEKCIDERIRSIEVTSEAEDRWLERMTTPHKIDLVAYYRACTPGFLNHEGDVDGQPTFLGSTYGGGCLAYNELIKEWRGGDQMLADCDIVYEAENAPA